jgi:hypothetical protein
MATSTERDVLGAVAREESSRQPGVEGIVW